MPQLTRQIEALTIAVFFAMAPSISRADIELAPVAGMTITTAIAGPGGDYESRKTYRRREGAAWQLDYAASVPGTTGKPMAVRATRVVYDKDVAAAVEYRGLFEDGVDEDYPNTTALTTSVAVLQSLKATGRSDFAMVGERQAVTQLSAALGLAGFAVAGQRLVGEIKRVGVQTFSVAVNGVPTTLKAIEASGRLQHKATPLDVNLVFLDHATHPVVLGWRAGKTTLRVVRIDLPQSAQGLAQKLKVSQRLVLPGVYFEFASAALRPESASALREAVAAIRTLPQSARVRVEGHTDNVGDAAGNLQLSRGRALSVRAALLDHWPELSNRVVADGLGAARPVADNATLQGRALNRRVELAVE